MSKGRILSKSISDMIKEIKQTRGAYEAKRLERAADEVPNLERLYQKDALEGLFRGENARGIMTMRPGDFERYAVPLGIKSSVGPKAAELARSGDISKGTVTTDEYIKHLQGIRGGAVRKADGGAATYNEAMLRRNRKFSQTDLEQMRREVAENARRIAAEKQARLDNPPPAEMTEYNPTLQQKLGSVTERGLRAIGSPAPRARELSGLLTGGSTGSPLPLGMSVMDFTPAAIPVYGGQGAMNAAEAAGKGNYGEAALELGLAGLDLAAAYPATKALARAAKPMVKAGAKAMSPKVGNLAEQYMMKTGMALPMDVWHGSPHKFDAFDSSKIGTGEGAQFYGHGLYFAENPAVAERYKNDLSKSDFKFKSGLPNPRNYPGWAWQDLPTVQRVGDAIKRGNDPFEYISTYRQSLSKKLGQDGINKELVGKNLKTLDRLEKQLLTGSARYVDSGSIYKVDLPDEQIAKMLDWDKTLSEQPESVQKVLKDLAERDAKMYGEGGGLDYYMGDPESYSGESVYRYLTEQQGGQPEVSNFFKDAGISGIKYFDASSRDAGEGTRNFVVFPGMEDILTIKERMKEGGPAHKAGGGVLRRLAKYGKQYEPSKKTEIFIGEKSQLWNAGAAGKAVELEKAGVSPVDIWKQTGTFRSPDGALRQEISDVGSKFRGEKKMKELAASMKQQEADIKAKIAESKLHPDLFPKQLTAAQKQARQQAKDIKARRTMEAGPEYSVSRGNRAEFALEHPELYEAYPLLSGMDVQQGGRSGSALGAYMRGIDERDPGMVEIYDRGLANDPRSITTHEMQHAIQNIEGWGRGGNSAMAFQNPEAFKILEGLRKTAADPITYEDYLKGGKLEDNEQARMLYDNYVKSVPDIAKIIDRELQSQAAELYYERLAGEAEARAAETRINLTPKQRLENFPLEVGTQYGYDVLPEDIIVKRQKKGGQVSLDAMRLAVGGAATSNEAMLRRERRLGKVEKPVSIDPKQLARGWAAGTTGILGDIESLGRAIIPGIDEKTFYQQYGVGAPTSEEMLKIIPGAATDEVGQRAAEIGTLFGGAGTALGGKLAAKGAKAIAPKLGETAEEYMFRAGMALPVIPPSKGSAKNIAMEKFFPGKTYDELSSAEKSAITRFESEMKNPAVRRREAFSGPTIIEPTVQMKEVKKVSPEEILKNPLMPLTGDVSGGGYKIKQVSGIPLEESVDVQGGYPYAFIHEMLGSPLGWASMSTAAKKKMTQAYDIAQKTGVSPLAVVTAMKNPESINFSTPVVEAMLRQLHAIDPSKGSIRDINKAIREKFGTYKERPDFVGIDDSDIIAQLRGESGFAREGSGDLRKKIVEIMSQAKYRKMGFPKYDDVADAIVAESLRGSDRGLSGSAIFKTDPNAPLISDPNIVQHLSYDTGIPRDITYPVSQLKDPIPAPVLYRDIFNQGMTEGFPLSEVDIKKKKVRRPLTSDEVLGALMMRNDLVQLPSQEHMDYVMNYMRKNFPESNYKKGGAVKKAAGGMASIPQKVMRAFVEAGKKAKLPEKAKEAIAKGETYIPDEETRQIQRELLQGIKKPEELAGGGQITSDDLILEERPL